MKKIFIAIALVAVMLNGFLATMGNRMSSDELNIGDVELVAEGEPDIGPAGIIVLGGIVDLTVGLGIYYVAQGGGEWVDHDEYKNGRLVKTTKECVRCSIFCSDNCKPGQSITHTFD